MNYMIIAGEASGDLHAAALITALRNNDPDAYVRFIGGDLMAQAAGREPEIHYKEINVMGFCEVIRRLPVIMRIYRRTREILRNFRPDALVLVDYPGFNLKIARFASRLGIPVHWFISPKVWAWKEYRVKSIRKYVSAMYSILPFEPAFYQKHGFRATYVGNPSVQEMDYALGHMPPLRHFMERQGITDERPIIALLPGSRRGEVRNNLPLMIEAAKRFPDYQYIVAAAPEIPLRFYREVAAEPGLKVVSGCTPTLVKHSAAALVTSGTATLETALLGTPQVVCYRANGSALSYRIMEKLLKVKYVSLPNLIAGTDVVTELLLHLCTAESIAHNLSPLLQASPRRDWQLNGYRTVRRKLGNFVASEYAAELICRSLGVKPSDNADEEVKVSSAPRRRKPRNQRKRATDDK